MAGKVYEIIPPFTPLIPAEATDFFDSLLNPSMAVFEWGSGRSTVWLAERVARVTSVEHVPAWRDEVVRALDAFDLEATVILVKSAEEYVNAIAPFDSLDVVFVDGGFGDYKLRYREIELAASRLKPEGWLVVDNFGCDKVGLEWECVFVRGPAALRDGSGYYSDRTGGTSFSQKPD